MQKIGWVAIAGFFVSGFMDNGTLGGGLLFGALAGWIGVPSDARDAAWRGGSRLERAGRVVPGMIRACSAAALGATLRALAG